MQLSENFSFEELTNSISHPSLVEQNRKDAGNYIGNLKKNALNIEDIRELLGVPLIVSSGFRNKDLNSAVGGSPTSKHMIGLCSDITPKDLDIQDTFNMLLHNKKLLTKLRKCIIEGVKDKTWIHIQAKVLDNEPTEFYSTSDGKNYTLVG
jgi:hypothetical protein